MCHFVPSGINYFRVLDLAEATLVYQYILFVTKLTTCNDTLFSYSEFLDALLYFWEIITMIIMVSYYLVHGCFGSSEHYTTTVAGKVLNLPNPFGKAYPFLYSYPIIFHMLSNFSPHTV
ncbi:hypothetical protein ACJX0J_027282, partial [Zea mays]